MHHPTAESLLLALASKGGVVVSSADMSQGLIAWVQAEGDWYAMPHGLGFARLDIWNHPADSTRPQ